MDDKPEQYSGWRKAQPLFGGISRTTAGRGARDGSGQMTRATPEAAPLPNWPALLRAELAALYCSVSETSFRFLARLYRVEPVDPGGLAVTVWRRADLDRMIDNLPARSAEIAPSSPSATAAPDPADTALERARRRALSGRGHG